MQRARVLSAIALVLGVIALGTVAGGLSGGGGADGEQSPGLGVGSGDGSGMGDSGDFGLQAPAEDAVTLPTWLGLGPFLLALWISLAAGVIAFLLFVWQASLRELLDALLETLGLIATIGIGIALLIALFFLLNGLFQPGGGGFLGDSGAAGEQILGDDSPSDSPSIIAGLAIVAGVAVLGLLLVMLLPDSRGDGGEATAEEPAGAEEPSDQPVRRVRPDADTEDPGASNEVYRAWVTLRDRVGRPDRTESPAELRARAIEAGLDERAVDELTALFNATRYGNRPVTSREEERAREALDALDGRGGTS